MEYILISMLTITVFTYVVSIIANKILATPIHMKSLILCACCALLISLILPRIFMGFAGLSGTLVILITFAMLSSYFIAYYYDNAIQTEMAPPISVALRDNPIEDFLVKISEKPLENTIEITAKEAEVTKEQRAKVGLIFKEYHYPLKYEDYHLKAKLQAVAQAVEKLDAPTEATVKPEIVPNVELENFLDELDMPTLEKTTLETIAEIPYEKPYSNALDDLMDFAFLQKEQRKFLEALETFRKALRLYPNSEVAPFLIVEISIILKNNGSYDEAINFFVEGRSLPSIINNHILEQEFISNIAYLRVVKNILVKNSLGFMPFRLIPESALKEIEEEFCQWRNQS